MVTISFLAVEENGANLAKQVEVQDSIGRFCGYLTEQQIRIFNEAYHREGNVLRLENTPSSKRKRMLLQESLNNFLTPQQNTRVAAQLGLLAENDERKQLPTTSFASLLDQIAASESSMSAPMTNDPSRNLFVTRDFNGYYLGLFTYDAARQVWRNAFLSSGIIVVRDRLSYRVSQGVLDPEASQIAHYSKSTMKGVDKAARFSNRLDRMRNLRSYWKSRAQYSYDVFGDQNEPLCCIPYENMRAFGDNWIVTGNSSVQLVSNWDEAEIAERVKLAISSASALYNEIAPAGMRSIRDDAQTDVSTGGTASASRPARSSNNEQASTSDATPVANADVTTVPSESIEEMFHRIIGTQSVVKSHAAVITEAAAQLSNRGRKSPMLRLLRAAYPTGGAALPHYGALDVRLISQRMLEGALDDADISSIIQAIDGALSAEDAEKAANETLRTEKLADAKRHDHAALAWADSVFGDDGASLVERELAHAVKDGMAPVLVMQDDELYRSVLNTEMSEQQFASAVEFVPFTHFIVHTPNMSGIYGFGVASYDDGTNAAIVRVTNGSGKSESSDVLDKYFKRLLFFICANRESLGLAPAVAPKGYMKEDRTDRRASSSSKSQPNPGKGAKPEENDDVVQGQVFELGTRIVYLSEGKGLRSDNHPGRDIRPHAVAGYTQTRSGKTIKVRPHWNHGSGSKRNELPQEIVERNIRLN